MKRLIILLCMIAPLLAGCCDSELVLKYNKINDTLVEKHYQAGGFWDSGRVVLIGKKDVYTDYASKTYALNNVGKPIIISKWEDAEVCQ